MTNALNIDKQRVLVLGASGMLGSAVLRHFVAEGKHHVNGTVRSAEKGRLLPEAVRTHLIYGIDVDSFDSLAQAFATVRPSVVINCIGLVKQLSEAGDPLSAIPVNSMLPHRLARLCAVAGSRLVHVSTDCVFAGSRGRYKESDQPDAYDLYGRSKLLGEVDYPHAITLRTSIIGHELASAHGLIGWFLSQHTSTRGYSKAIFSGLPTVELSRVVHDFVIPKPDLRGVYHVSSEPISKLELLRLVAKTYQKKIDIIPDERLSIDRSLDSTRFADAAGYVAPPWTALVHRMHQFG